MPPEEPISVHDAGVARDLAALREGGRVALASFLDRHRSRLRRMVLLRLDLRAQGRIDPSDVLQETFIDAAGRLERYLADPDMPPFLWLRFLAAQKLLQLHRRHLGAKGRDAAREISIYRGAFPEATSAALAARLVGQRTTASQAAMRAEMKLRLEEALNLMNPEDREVLALRHFEHLTAAETAQVLGIQEAAAAKRYLRALRRMKDVLAELGVKGD